MLADGVGPAKWGRVEGGAMRSTTLGNGTRSRSRALRLLTSTFALIVLTTGAVGLQSATSSATSRGPSSSSGSRVVAHAAGNIDFTGTWTITDPANGDTATLTVTDQKDDGSFSGTLYPPGDAPLSLSAPFPLRDAHVDGRHFTFTIERTGIGGTGPTDRDATYTANWDGTITGNAATGSIDAKTVPGTKLNPNGFAGQRSFSAHRPSSLTTTPATGAAAGGATIKVDGSGLDSAVSADITDADGNVLKSVPVSATGSGFSFSAPDLTQALHDADNAATAAGKPITQTTVEIVPHDGQGNILSPPADYIISAPIVGSVTPSEIAVGGGQSIVVKGSFFEGATAVDFQQVGSSTIVSAPATVASTHDLQFTTPDLQKFFAGSTAAQMNIDMYVRVNVTQAFGELIYSNSKPFVVDNLRIDSVTPSEGPLVGGDKVKVDGAGFTNVNDVDMIATGGSGKARTISIAVNPSNNTSFSFTLPDMTAAASVNASTSFDLVAVASLNGQRETSATSSADRYTYKGPSVSSLSVAGTTLAANSGSPIVVKGTFFQGATQVLLKMFGGGSETVTPNSVSADSVAFTLPDLTKDLKAKGLKTAKFNVIVEIPVSGGSLDFVDSVSSGSSEFNVKS
jgi:hypothetical protein